MHSQMYYELLVLIAIGLGCLHMVRFIRDKKYQNNEAEIGNEAKGEELNEVSMNKEKLVELTDGI